MKKNTLANIDRSQGIEFGLYTLGDHIANPHTSELMSAKERLQQIIEMAKLAEQAGMDIFQVGESHQKHFVSQAHMVILAVIAQVTDKIKLSSGATIISTSDPVRVFEDAATIDLISNGRMEIVAGRASRTGIFELLGYELADYELLYEEKLDLLLKINRNKSVTWEGEYRAPLNNAQVIPRPDNDTGSLPIWRAVGGSLSSARSAGMRGVPIYLSHQEGQVTSFSQLTDAYRQAAYREGLEDEDIAVATAGLLYVREDTKQAYKEYYPHVKAGLELSDSQVMSKQQFAKGMDTKNVLNIGDPGLIVEKLLYQHEVLGMNRYVGQIDWGGVPTDDIKRTIDLLATKVIPEVKKYTKK
ncbi:LLM class flavin-dependent oxidoreductase [Aerococcaceae bacterium WGS1372]